MSETPEPNELAPIDPIPPAEEGNQSAPDDGMSAAGDEQPVQPVTSAEEIPAIADDAVDVMQEENPEAEEEAEPYTDEQTAELRNVVESLIFASDEPIPAKLIRQLVEEVNKDRVEANRIRATTEGIKRAVTAINRTYDDRAFHIIQIAGGYAFATKPKFSAFVGKLAKEKARRKLSATAIESLAIIAYKQPITKSEIEFIRGVNADYIIKTLLEKNLITITGRASTPGRPLLYGTTDEFLKHFGLHEITDLPKPREIEELIGETELEVEKRLLAEQQELEFKDELAQKMDGGQKAKSSGPRPPLRQHTGKKPEAPITAPPADMPPSNGTPVPEEATQTPAAEPVTTETVQAEEEAVVESAAVADQAVEVTPVEETISQEAAVEETIAEAPVVEPAEIEEPVAEEALEPVELEEPVAEETIVEPAEIEEPLTEEYADGDAVVEEHVAVEEIDEAPVEDSAGSFPIYMPPADDMPLAVEETTEASAIEEPVVEAQTEEAVVEEPEIEETAADEQIVETIIVEEPVAEETAAIEEPAETSPERSESLVEEMNSEAAPEQFAASSVEQETHAHEAHDTEGEEAHAHEKGWSKWKTKIKTFFKKLFV